MPDFFPDRLHDDGLRYDAYRAHWRDTKDASPGTDPSERKMHHYLNYNWERQAHVHDAYTPSNALRAAVTSIEEPQIWMVLTEPWCGDSAFLLPVIAEAAALTDDVTLRILLRDDHLDVMDQYLTDGSRSIPKLVAFTEDGEQQFTWGPRPEGSRELFADLKEKYDDKQTVIAELVEHYENGAWRDADAELATAIRASLPAQPAE
jgi:thioredoxin-like negative regulator of GroEL